MLAIRLFRIGKKHQPVYKVVVTDKRNAPSGGRFTDQVGVYNPCTKEKNFDKEKILNWIKNGAQPSDTVYNLLVSEGILKGEKRKIKMEKPKVKEAEPEEEKKEEPKQEETKKEEIKEEVKEETKKEEVKEETKKEEAKPEA